MTEKVSFHHMDGNVEKPSADSCTEHSTASVEQARNKFDAEVGQLRESWAYDWIIPLVLSDLLDGASLGYRIHSLHKIRTKLHELQTKMVID
jgi:hypothetical protein